VKLTEELGRQRRTLRVSEFSRKIRHNIRCLSSVHSFEDLWNTSIILQEIDFDGTPTGHYKIGKTKAGTEARKRQYQAGNPRFLDPFHTVEVTNSQTVETDLHHRFDSYRLKGYGGGDEWFNFHSVDMEKFVSIMNEYNETPAYVPPEPVYYQQSYSSPDFELSGLLTNPILGFVLLLVFLLVVVGGSLKPVNLGNQPSGKEKARWSQRSCINPNGCSGTIDASSTGYKAANVRAAPDKNSKLITTLNNGQKVTVFEESNGWIKVELDSGIKGWVANNLVR